MDNELKNSILKTGTTILGIICKNGVIMASDRRATAGNMVLSKNTKKAVKVNDYLVMSGTGNASDIEMQKKIIAAQLKLKELKSKKRPSVKEAANLIGMITYQNIRQPAMIPSIVGTLVAGFNEDGTTELYTIEPAGTAMKVEDYDANFGSGMPFVLGLLERQYKEDMTVEEATKLAVEAIKSSTQRDTGSGSGIDVFIITKEGIKQVVEQEITAEYKDRKKTA
ncbi:MAG: proteasome subunit beta [Candidatus Nanoarchaeia archaeon]|nr:proteasome subunit beta [Candidatus Nanoarchaeia archaeon]MDD5741269.1 proteasome subunit beta [Candidatus Nanoarchaeia archaeon]